MTVWAIADLHLSFARDDDRARFAGRWRDHAEKVAREWRSVVHRDDVVLIPGDISQARNHREVQPDLAWLDRLPGIKILSPGNHDGWWNGAKKVRPMLRRSLRCVGGDAVDAGEIIACGTAGAAVGDPSMDREIASLAKSIDEAVTLRGDRAVPIVALWHYPPFDTHGQPGPAVEVLEQANIAACVYGHLHAQGQWATATQGEVGGVLYRCVAADAIGFRPLKIISSASTDPPT